MLSEEAARDDRVTLFAAVYEEIGRLKFELDWVKKSCQR
jgi:hypothetical protein